MEPLNKFNVQNTRVDIIRRKKSFGMYYGMAAGIAFASVSWGRDAYLLSQSHAYFPWTMLVVGVIFCAVLGGIIGRLTARSESSLFGALYWFVAGIGFAWLMVALPLRINPAIVSKFDPQLGGLLNYAEDGGFMLRVGTSLLWVIPFTLIVGVTQLPITEPAVFSTSVFGKIVPLLFCIVVMSISGSFTDELINVHFRSAIISLDKTIQFVVDNKDNENIDKELSREMHAGALKLVKDQVRESRRLFVGSYDEYLGDMQVFVKFDDQWVDCHVLYIQPLSCERVTGK
jgi:hypothetical protein